MESLEFIANFINSCGYPIATSAILMIYMFKLQKDMTDTINELRNAITILTERIEK